jgi:hypothetical protein
MRWLYKYPQRAFPYEDLIRTNGARKGDGHAPEYELLDTGIFDENRYFDVDVSYAKAGPEDICIRITVSNRGPEAAHLDVLPTLWYRNQWSWSKGAEKPTLSGSVDGVVSRVLAQPASGTGSPMTLYAKDADGLLFAENESNAKRLWGSDESPRYPKDGINDHLVHGADTVNPALSGTKASARWNLTIGAGDTRVIELRLSAQGDLKNPFGADFTKTFSDRQGEADAYWASIAPDGTSEDRQNIMRQAYAGMLWSKQRFNYAVKDWLNGDEGRMPPPSSRTRNAGWQHFNACNILSMPDTWEYPWFAAWDLCFHTVVFARIDPAFAKDQLLTLAHEWYMSPNGAMPAYEWNFDDTNPPLHAWAALRIFEIEQESTGGTGDLDFLEDIFRHGLILFTWWANQQDVNGNDLFGGGFLGLDNISIINRSNLEEVSERLGSALQLLQSDGTSWMGQFSLNLMDMALRLAQAGRPGYNQLAVKFLQHFINITDSINGVHGGDHPDDAGVTIWNEDDGYFYDILRVIGNNGARDQYLQLRLRSLVGVIALFPSLVVDLEALPHSTAQGMGDRMQWLIDQHPELFNKSMEQGSDRLLLSFVNKERLTRVLRWVLDESELLSPHGVRGISKAHANPPYTLWVNGHALTEGYAPAESVNQDFGGNSNWRGPIWFPINFMLIETLRRYHSFYGDELTVAYPTGSDQQKDLGEIADDLSQRMVAIFERNSDGKRPVYGSTEVFQNDPHWRDHILFFEYFHGDNGAGIGASHQTGWTGLVAELLRR